MAKKQTKKAALAGTITSFDRPTIRALVDEIREALEPVAAKYGLRLERKTCTYGATETPVPFRFLVIEKDAEGNEMSSDAKKFVEQARFFGFKPTDLHREVAIGSRKLRIIGLRPRSSKYPVLMEEIRTGKVYKYPTEAVGAALEKALEKAG